MPVVGVCGQYLYKCTIGAFEDFGKREKGKGMTGQYGHPFLIIVKSD